MIGLGVVLVLLILVLLTFCVRKIEPGRAGVKTGFGGLQVAFDWMIRIPFIHTGLRLDEFKPRVLTSFVRNQFIDQVYLPLIGDNLAKQMGAAVKTSALTAAACFCSFLLRAMAKPPSSNISRAASESYSSRSMDRRSVFTPHRSTPRKRPTLRRARKSRN